MIKYFLFGTFAIASLTQSFFAENSTMNVSSGDKDSSKTTARTKKKSDSDKTDRNAGSECESSSQESATTSSHYNLASLPSTAANQAYLIDFESGAVLFEKNASILMSPSSMTKIATACYVAHKIQQNELSLDSKFPVSRNAYRKEGSTMFLNIGQNVLVSDLLGGLIVASANDAAVVLGEGISGSESAFAQELTSYVRSWGCMQTNFTNASGLPDGPHKTTASDLAIIACHAVLDFPGIWPIYSQNEFTFNGVTQPNKNVLLNREIGCDGLKTGHTNDGGYGIVATCVQGGRRLILVVNGYKSEQERASDASALIGWGAKMFVNHFLYKRNTTVVKIPVWYGEESELPVTVESDVIITLPRASRFDARIVLHYYTPVPAPIQKGTQVGEIVITSNAMKRPIIVPLIASISVKEGGFWKKVVDSFLYLVWGARRPRPQ
jgi:D-alanyl-D-alanine carboxypeptidase (penicillin-binding protein 5/6)